MALLIASSLSGLRIINTLLGGGAPSDGIDKVDNGGSPMQVIGLFVILFKPFSFAIVPLFWICVLAAFSLLYTYIYTHLVIGLFLFFCIIFILFCILYLFPTIPQPKNQFAQGILAAVLSSVLGTRDPDQVNSMAKQAGEVNHYCLHTERTRKASTMQQNKGAQINSTIACGLDSAASSSKQAPPASSLLYLLQPFKKSNSFCQLMTCRGVEKLKNFISEYIPNISFALLHSVANVNYSTHITLHDIHTHIYTAIHRYT